ncbi:hypothetical protein D3C83_53850 [compost metagenome]
MADNTGLALTIASLSSPPIMMVREPVMARGLAPDTGASSNTTCFRASSFASACVPVGSDELMSITTVPALTAL